MHEIWEYTGEPDNSYPDKQLVGVAICILTGLSHYRTYKETGVDRTTIHWMSTGIWYKDIMLKAYTLLAQYKVPMKQSRIDAIL